MPSHRSYLQATRHPWASLWFLLPLLAIYEYGVISLAGNQPETLRNGADNWVRQTLSALGLRTAFALPLILLAVLLCWCYRRWGDRPREMMTILPGMMIESVAYALLLWVLSRTMSPLLDMMQLTVPSSTYQFVTYLGAGIYEETLFRLFLFSLLVWFFKKADVPTGLAVSLAAIISAVFFALAHNIGPYGEPYDPYTFLFRTSAGVYFAILFRMRGFGIVVGAHALYDVVIGITLAPSS